MAWIMAHWQDLAVAVIAVAELVSLFVPSASGTLQGIIKVLVGLGVKDPQIGQK
jgi:hypothetical protein